MLMAGFRGVPPSRETVELIAGNLLRARQGLGQVALVTPDPFASRCPAKHSASLHDQVHVNDALLDVFLGLLDGSVVPNA